jgi:capsular polysaccharide biosynthesis protein
LKEKVSQLDAELTAAVAKRAQLKREITGLGKAILDVPKKEQELVALRRDYSVNSSIYNNLLKRLEEARETKEMEVQDRGGRIRVIEPATVPYKPVKPNRVLILLMGIGGGISAGYGFGFLRHLMDSTIRSSDEIQGLVGLTVLGRIPTVVTHGDRRRRHRANLAFGMATVMTVVLFGSVLWLEMQGVGLYPLRALVGV